MGKLETLCLTPVGLRSQCMLSNSSGSTGSPQGSGNFSSGNLVLSDRPQQVLYLPDQGRGMIPDMTVGHSQTHRPVPTYSVPPQMQTSPDISRQQRGPMFLPEPQMPSEPMVQVPLSQYQAVMRNKNPFDAP